MTFVANKVRQAQKFLRKSKSKFQSIIQPMATSCPNKTKYNVKAGLIFHSSVTTNISMRNEHSFYEVINTDHERRDTHLSQDKFFTDVFYVNLLITLNMVVTGLKLRKFI